MRRITLLTDFGTADGYVAAMKGVIATTSPDAIIDDATHEIAPGDIAAGAFALARYWRAFPPGTVHVAVVDPGVGSERRALAATADGRHLVAPDNGILTRVFDEASPTAVVSVENEHLLAASISATFHGRDVFAPAAAHLARGGSLDELGPAVNDPVRLDIPMPERRGKEIGGTVVAIDRFGNLITNIPGEWVADRAQVQVDGKDVGPRRRTYTDVASGDVLALVGSTGALEVAVRDGRASVVLGVGVGADVVVKQASRAETISELATPG